MTDKYRVLSILTLRRALKADTPISGRELAEAAAVNSTVVLRGIIHELRMEGEPICSCGAGYWLAVNDAELMDNSIQLERFALSVLNAARGMRSRVIGQMEIGNE